VEGSVDSAVATKQGGGSRSTSATKPRVKPYGSCPAHPEGDPALAASACADDAAQRLRKRKVFTAFRGVLAQPATTTDS